MGKPGKRLTPQHIAFIQERHVFFVATAPNHGKINLSPKGIDTFRILDDTTVAWLNLTGSGNETAAHVLENGRMTIMMCAFEGSPNILRIYGTARAVHPGDKEWPEVSKDFPELPGTRQIFIVHVDGVMNSCGFGVPIMEYKEERSTLLDWADKKGEEGIMQYQLDNNVTSLDGLETGLPTSDIS